MGGGPLPASSAAHGTTSAPGIIPHRRPLPIAHPPARPARSAEAVGRDENLHRSGKIADEGRCEDCGTRWSGAASDDFPQEGVAMPYGYSPNMDDTRTAGAAAGRLEVGVDRGLARDARGLRGPRGAGLAAGDGPRGARRKAGGLRRGPQRVSRRRDQGDEPARAARGPGRTARGRRGHHRPLRDPRRPAGGPDGPGRGGRHHHGPDRRAPSRHRGPRRSGHGRRDGRWPMSRR